MDRKAFHPQPALVNKMLAEAQRHVQRRPGRRSGTTGNRSRNVGDDRAAVERLRSTLFVLTGKLPPENLSDLPVRELAELATRLRQSIARERGKARSGHRSYDVNRHIALHQALRSLDEIINRTRPRLSGGGANA